MPGSWNLTSVIHLPSGGGSGMVKGGDHGEFAHARVSVHVFICSGLNATAEALPRYTIHDNRKPGPLEGTIEGWRPVKKIGGIRFGGCRCCAWSRCLLYFLNRPL